MSETGQRNIDVYSEQPQAVLISNVNSITEDIALEPNPELMAMLDRERPRDSKSDKLVVRNIEKLEGGYRITLQDNRILDIAHQACAHKNTCFGGGLANLGRDLAVIQHILDGNPNANGNAPRELPLKFLTLSATAREFPDAETIPGSPRISLVFEGPQFPKLLITEGGPHIEPGNDVGKQEREFIGEDTNVVFIGQEPMSSEKFQRLIELKQKKPNTKIFWLIGSNQIKEGVEKHRDLLSIVDVVSLNLTEATKFLGLPELRPEHDRASEIREKYSREVSRQFAELGVKNIIITDGARGASLARRNPDQTVSFIHAPLKPKRDDEESGIVEDTGCGDGFAAGIAAYFLRDEHFDIQKAADFAHDIAGQIYRKKDSHLTARDGDKIRRAWHEAEFSSRFTEMRMHHFPVGEFQIKVEAARATRAVTRKKLILLLGTPVSGRVIGTDALLAGMMPGGEHERLAKYVHVIPEYTDQEPKQHHDTTVALNLLNQGLPPEKRRFQYIDTEEMRERIKKGEFHPTLLTQPEGKHGGYLGVLRKDLMRPAGIDLVHVGFLEALEILTRQDIADLYGGNIEVWHFGNTPENLAERLDNFERMEIIASNERGGVQAKIRADHVRAEIADRTLSIPATDPHIVAEKNANQMVRLLDEAIQNMGLAA